MKRISLVYKYLLSELRGEHFSKAEPLPNRDELMRWTGNYIKHPSIVERFKNQTFTDEFHYSEKTYLFEKGFFEMVRTRWNVTDEQIIERGLVDLPTFIENRLISGAMKKTFGEWIFSLPVFKGDQLRFDRRNFRRGFMRPIFQGKDILGFEVFRDIKDREPIQLVELSVSAVN